MCARGFIHAMKEDVDDDLDDNDARIEEIVTSQSLVHHDDIENFDDVSDDVRQTQCSRNRFFTTHAPYEVRATVPNLTAYFLFITQAGTG